MRNQNPSFPGGQELLPDFLEDTFWSRSDRPPVCSGGKFSQAGVMAVIAGLFGSHYAQPIRKHSEEHHYGQEQIFDALVDSNMDIFVFLQMRNLECRLKSLVS